MKGMVVIFLMVLLASMAVLSMEEEQEKHNSSDQTDINNHHSIPRPEFGSWDDNQNQQDANADHHGQPSNEIKQYTKQCLTKAL
ncbi:hypothetical protein IHE45_14G013300 [Dioscorea alata]|uniref:Uncharacterized protein n=1 Tax=Dioscorea alata TaxID=55571 RepID=A0ACB7UQ54_DIOAL|nr:hypothetical protein IHE45_14G013300 [Dioscorea alata]